LKLSFSEPIHAPGTLEEALPPEKCLGPVDPSTVQHADEEKEEKEEKAVDIQGIPPIHQVINIDDFEVLC
jgi:L-lactate dehydrogenase (cytochrome)